MSEEKKFNLIDVEVNKISLQPGDVLLAKVKSPDFKDDEVCETLKSTLRAAFPNNKVGVLFLEENQIDFTVISQEVAQILEKASNGEETVKETPCNTQKTCVDCNCGKKQQILNDLPKEE